MAGWKPKNCEIKHPKKYRMSFYDILAENTVKTLCHFVAKMNIIEQSNCSFMPLRFEIHGTSYCKIHQNYDFL